MPSNSVRQSLTYCRPMFARREIGVLASRRSSSCSPACPSRPRRSAVVLDLFGPDDPVRIDFFTIDSRREQRIDEDDDHGRRRRDAPGSRRPPCRRAPSASTKRAGMSSATHVLLYLSFRCPVMMISSSSVPRAGAPPSRSPLPAPRDVHERLGNALRQRQRRVPLPAIGMMTSWHPSVAVFEPNDVVDFRRGRLEQVTRHDASN